MFLDFYKSLKVKLIERSKDRKEGLGKVAKDAAFIFGALAVLCGVATAAGEISISKKRKRKEVASNICESCGTQLTKAEGIIGHLDHAPTNRDRKHSESNIRLHCLACESEWHLSHVGNAEDIGLSELDNKATVIGRLLEMIRGQDKKFVDLCGSYKELIRPIFLKLYFSEPKLTLSLFEDQNMDLPFDIELLFDEILNISISEFVYFYLGYKTNVNDFFVESSIDIPVDLISFFSEMIEDSEFEFMKIYFILDQEIEEVFKEHDFEISLDKKLFLENLLTEDIETAWYFYERNPLLFQKITAVDLSKDALS